jgi:hypothetical protein
MIRVFVKVDDARLPNARKGWWYGAIRDLVDGGEAILNPGELAEQAADAAAGDVW